MIRELYYRMACGENGEGRISRETEEAAERLLEFLEKKTDSRDHGRYRDEIYLAVSAAEENGFVRGFRSAFRLFADIIREPEM